MNKNAAIRLFSSQQYRRFDSFNAFVQYLSDRSVLRKILKQPIDPNPDPGHPEYKKVSETLDELIKKVKNKEKGFDETVLKTVMERSFVRVASNFFEEIRKRNPSWIEEIPGKAGELFSFMSEFAKYFAVAYAEKEINDKSYDLSKIADKAAVKARGHGMSGDNTIEKSQRDAKASGKPGLDIEVGKDGKPRPVLRNTSTVTVKLPNGEKKVISDVDLYRDILSGNKIVKNPTRPTAGSLEDLQIRGIQTVLKNSVNNDLAVDGIYGQGTAAAVRTFQGNNNISVDGKVGRQTISKMIDSRKDIENVPVSGRAIPKELEDKLLSKDKVDKPSANESVVRLDESTLRRLIRESLRKLI